MNILQSLGWNISREIIKRAGKSHDDHVKENVIDKNSKFQKKHKSLSLNSDEGKNLKLWKEYVWDLDQEYLRPSNAKRKDQISLLRENIDDADYELSRIKEIHPDIFDECKEIYENVRIKLVEKLK
jgi:hypothetical protein